MLRNFTILLWTLFTAFTLTAQESFIYKDVAKAKQDRGIAEVIDLKIQALSSSNGDQKTVTSEIAFELDQDNLSRLITNQAQYLELTFPGLKGEELNLELIKVDIHSEGFKVTIDDKGDKYELPYDPAHSSFYRGIVNGEPSSLVAISLFNGEVSGVISSDNSGDLGIRKSKKGGHVIADLKQSKNAGLACSTEDDGIGYDPAMLEMPKRDKAVGDYVSVFVEVEGDFTENQGGVSNTLNYMQGLFNETATLFANDGIDLRVSEFEINTSEEYSTRRGNRLIKPSSSSTYLSRFQSAKSSSFNGDLAHLVAYNNVGGVAAGFSGICNSDRRESMCISGFVSDYFFNLQIFAHEMGHLFGSRHTHACVWNGNNTAIDGCAGGTEGTCSTPSTANQGPGTLMSYCYNNFGVDFNEGFHPQPAAVMNNSVASATCLMSGGGNNGPNCFDGIQNGDETGVDCGGSCTACPTCNDGIQNGDETGIDCGGSCPDTCPTPACDNPSNLVVRNMKNRKGTGRAILDWADVSGAASYDVRVRAVGGSTWTDLNSGSSSITVEGFAGGGDYEWEVRANCSGGSSDYVGCTFTYINRGSNVTCGTVSPGAGSLAADQDEKIFVYPNPVSSILNIEIENGNSETYEIKMFNSTGQQILNNTMSADVPWLEVNVGGYNSGLYFISISQEEKTTVKKIFIE